MQQTGQKTFRHRLAKMIVSIHEVRYNYNHLLHKLLPWPVSISTAIDHDLEKFY